MKKSKRTILSLLLTLVLVFSIAGSASARSVIRFRTANARTTWSTVRSCLQNPAACIRQILTQNGATRQTENSTPAKQTEPPTPAQPSKPAETTGSTGNSDPATNGGASSGSTTVQAYEKAVADLVNQQRAKYGLSPLTLSADLCVKARIKSQDMASNRYFSHTSPTYGSPFEMMKSLGIRYSYAGENIAMGYASPEAVVTAWMNSEGHRANILSANYTTIGVGYVASGNYWTQWFLG